MKENESVHTFVMTMDKISFDAGNKDIETRKRLGAELMPFTSPQYMTQRRDDKGQLLGFYFKRVVKT